MQFEISDTEKRQNAVGADSGKQEKLKTAKTCRGKFWKTRNTKSGKQETKNPESKKHKFQRRSQKHAPSSEEKEEGGEGEGRRDLLIGSYEHVTHCVGSIAQRVWRRTYKLALVGHWL